MAEREIKKIVRKVGDSVATAEPQKLQPEETRAITSILPREGHANVGHNAFSILADVIRDKDKKKLPNKWFRNYELYRARHWRSQGSARLSTVNLIWNFITRTVNLLTDNSPTFNITAENDDVALKIDKVARYWWNETEQQDTLSNSVTMSEINGCVVEKVIFNPALNSGLGEVEVITVDPHQFGFWPLNELNSNKWEAALYYYPIPVNQARRKWPEMAEFIIPDKLWRDKLGESRREIFGGSARATPGRKEYGDFGVDHATFTGNVNALGKVMGGKNEVLILEFWVKDYTMDTIELEPAVIETAPTGTTSKGAGHTHEYQVDETGNGSTLHDDTGHLHEIVENGILPTENHQHDLEMITTEAVTEKRAKYPGNIRTVTTCNGGDVVLSDRPNPSINPTLDPELASLTYLWDKFPFTITQSNRDTVTAWGFSSIEQLESLNFEVDKCLSQLNLLKDKNVRSPIINPRDAQVPNRHFTNAPAKVINPKNHIVAAAIGFMKPPPVHRDIEHILGIYRELFDKISGVFDMTDPSIAKGRMAFKTVATILESMHTMLRGKIRSYGKMIRDRGRMWLSHAANWYTEERLFFGETDAGVPESGVFTGKEFLTQLKFSVVTGSTMPTSRLQQREEAKELFQVGAIDIRELLIRLDWPNRAEVIKRMELGQLGPLLEKMEALGVNPEVLELVQKIAEMDESEYNAVVQQMKEAQADTVKTAESIPAITP